MPTRRPPIDDRELELRARARLELMHEDSQYDLGSFVELTTPKYRRPTHLAPIVKLLDESMRRPLCATFSVPPRHFKTDTLLHHLARMMRFHPDRMNAYATYSDRFAERKSRKLREIAHRAQVPLTRAVGKSDTKPAATVGYWQTTEGGGLLAVGQGAGFTGDGVTGALVVDDPHKGRKEAESQTQRDDVWEWFTDVALTRIEHPASVFVVHTRWHEDDLIGRIKSSPDFDDWHHVNLAAIADEDDPLGRQPGEALAPHKFTAEYFAKLRKRIGEYSWSSLYQGSPRPKGGRLFGPTRYYTQLPTTPLVFAYGLDMAYTKKTTSDWSVVVWMAMSINERYEPVYYILHVDREQVRSPEFGALVRARLDHHHAPVFWRAVGPEIGSADLMAEHLGVPFQILPTYGDKFIHAQSFSAAWNDGRVLLPADQPTWVRDFEREIGRFTGVNDPNDDQVDAAVNAYDGLRFSSGLKLDGAFDRMLPGMRM